MKKSWIILSFFLLAFGVSFAQNGSNANDGNKNLQNPGTRSKPVKEDSINGFHPISGTNLELPKSNPHDQIITHKGYTLSFNLSYHIADWVAYKLTAEQTVPVVERNNHFVSDPLLTSCSISNDDYKNSGYDKGHLAPSADMCYSQQTMAESFYLSNMSPQVPSFNRGIWKKLEEKVRQWAIEDNSVFVVTGAILTKGLPTIGLNKITVPEYFYKVILDYTEPEIKGIGFIIPNQGSQEPLQHFAVTIDSVEKVTGIDFFYKLPKDQQRIIESTVDLNEWHWTTLKPHQKTDTHNSGTIHSGSKRCTGLTKKGTQCSRMTSSPNGKCWQHGGD